MSKSDLEKLTDELRISQGAEAPRTPTLQEVSDLASNHGAPLSPQESKAAENLISTFASSNGIPWLGTSSMAAPVTPPVAEQALAASVNAAAGGTLIAAGLEFKQKLTATVHDEVVLTFKDSYIKNTLGETVYHHEGPVKIDATDVRLKASKININAWIEKNTVEASKESYRYATNISVGSLSGLLTATSNNSVTGIAGDFSVFNMSLGAIRLGTAAAMSHYGDSRNGKKFVALKSATSKSDRAANLIATAFTMLFII
ncbi:hypothetical protein [Bordetella genomosp. 4]|uniref:Uncharacterized protein n=1 Tax=Bordetella genomosp. 4 TaxID=463044 RepID=A0A261UB28_9BORD|nr:hypothetical protein [Bordetella genomosp. 4]OZI52674.1 hypothetical protein CAL21_03350 [Bordetella genomosp. 4]OZI59128.1 hypothetical protein CAL20_05725 [Bordetella genomosp. 4]